jgi:hypothetical protein
MEKQGRDHFLSVDEAWATLFGALSLKDRRLAIAVESQIQNAFYGPEEVAPNIGELIDEEGTTTVIVECEPVICLTSFSSRRLANAIRAGLPTLELLQDSADTPMDIWGRPPIDEPTLCSLNRPGVSVTNEVVETMQPTMTRGELSIYNGGLA